MKIEFRNAYIHAIIELVPFFHLESLIDRKSGKNLLTSVSPTFQADRKTFPCPTFLSKEQCSETHYRIVWRTDDLMIERNLFFYPNSPAIRWYDTFSSETDKSGIYYSDLAAFRLTEIDPEMECVHFYSCSDQSNHRMIAKKTVPGKNVGTFVNASGLFFYKEGPMPDSQPIPGEYDFLWNPSEKVLNIVGLGFENLHKGEKRRANGVVVGLTRDFGRQRYWLERYPDYPRSASAEVLSNSWPDLTLGVNEEAIEKEIHAAATAGINCVFIDDGWFSTFMGEIDEKKFPNKFTRLTEIAKGYGIEIGLWCDPLGIDITHPKALLWDGAECHDTMLEPNPWNWMARTVDYTYCEVHPAGERTYVGADLMNPEYFEHIRTKLLGVYKEYGIRHFKFDLYRLHNFNTLLGDAQLHYEAYRMLLEALKKEIPELVISMDVTRRGRPNFDFALDYGRLFLENRGRNIPDHRYYHPYMALGNHWYTLKYAPARQQEVEMMPQAEDYTLEYILGTTIFATPLYWGCIGNTSETRRKQMKDFFQMMAPYRAKFASYLTSSLGEMPMKGTWSAILSVAPDDSEGFLAVYRNGADASEYEFQIPFGRTLRRIFGGGTAVIRGNTLTATQQEPYSCSLYQFVK